MKCKSSGPLPTVEDCEAASGIGSAAKVGGSRPRTSVLQYDMIVLSEATGQLSRRVKRSSVRWRASSLKDTFLSTPLWIWDLAKLHHRSRLEYLQARLMSWNRIAIYNFASIFGISLAPKTISSLRQSGLNVISFNGFSL